ncbi:MAG: hypothetical protein ACI9VR_003302 [Cognaticolwellia sp.]
MRARLKAAWLTPVGGWPLTLLSLLACGVMAWMWAQVALSTSWARIAALQTVETYAFAAYQQIVHNLSLHGVFEQTLHKGYADAWAWSGHRSGTIFLASWFYRLNPTSLGLARFQIFTILAGVIPAMGLGRQGLKHPVGWALGALIYLGTPPVMAIALQDYQDLALALPALVFLAWSLRAHWAWVPLAALCALLPREETTPLVLVMALSWPPGGWRSPHWRRWALNLSLCALMTLGWVGASEAIAPAEEAAYQMPLSDAVGGLGGGGAVIFLDGWSGLESFYLDLAWPTGVWGLLNPVPLAVSGGMALFHMSIPAGHAVDRSWVGHSHHIAPGLAFGMVASIGGAAWLLSKLGAMRVSGAARIAGLTGLFVLLFISIHGRFGVFAKDHALLLGRYAPAWTHPAWGLAAQLPPDAIPIVPVHLSLVVADRRTAYTLNASLRNKAPDMGLAAGTHALIDTRETATLVRIRSMPGAKLEAQDSPFELWSWHVGRPDPTWTREEPRGTQTAPEYLGPFRRPEQIPGVPAHVSAPVAQQGKPAPSIRIPWREGQAGEMGPPGPDPGTQHGRPEGPIPSAGPGPQPEGSGHSKR